MKIKVKNINAYTREVSLDIPWETLEPDFNKGEWALFYANSNSKQEANWDQGVLSGSWTEWYADGTKSFEGTRKRSVKKEKWTIWNEKIQRSISTIKK